MSTRTRKFKRSKPTNRKRKGRKRMVRKSSLRLGGFPSSKMVKLRYAQEVSMTGGVGQVHVFRANSLYDPDSTGTGSQPANFDRWMAVYDHYTVLGARITVRHSPTSTTDQAPAYTGILLSDDGTSSSGMTVSTIMEQSGQRTYPRILGLVNDINRSLSLNFSASKFFGKTKASLIGDGTYRGTSLANPTEQAYFEIYQKPVGGNTPGVFNYMVIIDYIAVLTEKKVDEDA